MLHMITIIYIKLRLLFRRSENKMTIKEPQFNELVSSVRNTLQSDGTLNKLKAQLRASVIKVLEPSKTLASPTRSDHGTLT